MQKCTLYFAAFVLTFFIPGPANAQAKKAQACFYTRERAMADIQENKAKILVQGGFAPIIYNTDKMFFEQYKVLEEKQVQIDKFQNKEEAYTVINEAIDFYKKNFGT